MDEHQEKSWRKCLNMEEGGRKEENGCNPSYCPPAVLLKKKQKIISGCFFSRRIEDNEKYVYSEFGGGDYGVFHTLRGLRL